jgi:hypothetical protein
MTACRRSAGGGVDGVEAGEVEDRHAGAVVAQGVQEPLAEAGDLLVVEGADDRDDERRRATLAGSGPRAAGSSPAGGRSWRAARGGRCCCARARRRGPRRGGGAGRPRGRARLSSTGAATWTKLRARAVCRGEKAAGSGCTPISRPSRFGSSGRRTAPSAGRAGRPMSGASSGARARSKIAAGCPASTRRSSGPGGVAGRRGAGRGRDARAAGRRRRTRRAARRRPSSDCR